MTKDQVLGHVREGQEELSGFRLALVHHPLDNLSDHHNVRRLLSDHVDVLLHGHQHEPAVMTLDESCTSIRTIASGCLVEGERGKYWPNGFQLIEVELPSRAVTVYFRKWASAGSFWAPGSDIYANAPDGTLRLAPMMSHVTREGGGKIGPPRIDESSMTPEALSAGPVEGHHNQHFGRWPFAALLVIAAVATALAVGANRRAHPGVHNPDGRVLSVDASIPFVTSHVGSARVRSEGGSVPDAEKEKAPEVSQRNLGETPGPSPKHVECSNTRTRLCRPRYQAKGRHHLSIAVIRRRQIDGETSSDVPLSFFIRNEGKRREVIDGIETRVVWGGAEGCLGELEGSPEYRVQADETGTGEAVTRWRFEPNQHSVLNVKLVRGCRCCGLAQVEFKLQLLDRGELVTNVCLDKVGRFTKGPPCEL